MKFYAGFIGLVFIGLVASLLNTLCSKGPGLYLLILHLRKNVWHYGLNNKR